MAEKKENQEKKVGILFLVSTPIGNIKDITLRALDVFQSADVLIFEERRRGSTLLKKLGIEARHTFELNEHNEEERTAESIGFLKEGKTIALFSDCGTPVFADPGRLLVQACLEEGYRVIPVPGPSSLMTAISISPLPMDEFYFAGFLPRDTEKRNSRIKHLKKFHCPIILMDTPYRLNKLLREIETCFGSDLTITLALDLTQQSEGIYHGLICDIRREMEKRKAEFILILHP